MNKKVSSILFMLVALCIATELEAQKGSLAVENRDPQAIIAELQATITAVQATIAEVQAKVDKITTELEAQNGSLAAENRVLQANIAELQSKIAELEKQCAALAKSSSKNRELTANNAKLKADIAELEKRRAGMERLAALLGERDETRGISAPPQEWTDPVTGMPFVEIKEGCSLMGSPETDKSLVSLCLDGFWIGKYEVTQEQWQKVMGVGNNPSSFKGDLTRPVETVSWTNVQEFLSKLNSKVEKNSLLPLSGGKYRLPTEAEWEYACRAGTQMTYSFGDDAKRIGDYAWYKDNSDGKTHPVGKLNPNPWRLYDMHGNVWEWCQDPKNPQSSSSDEPRVLRGGSWDDVPIDVRCAVRFSIPPASQHPNVGLRVVIAASGQ